MVESKTLEGEWQDLAIDDGSVVLQANEYYAELDDGNNVISTQISSISYSPSVNKAKNMKVDVPPDTILEDETYLGETINIYVDKKLLFTGDIVVIETNQQEGEDYTIEAEPPGKRLKGEDIDRRASNELVYDTIANVIDTYNDFDAQHSALRESGSETLVDVEPLGFDILEVAEGESSGQAFYTALGNSISDIDAVYVQAYTPANSDIKASIVSDSKSTSVTKNSLDTTRYGEWFSIQPEISNVSEKYSLNFDLSGDTRLIDWIVITDHEIKREVTSPSIDYTEPTPNGNEQAFYSKTSDELVEEVARKDDGIAVFNTDTLKEIRTRKVSAWASFSDTDSLNYASEVSNDKKGTLVGNDNAIEGGEIVLDKGQQTPDLSNRLSIFKKFENYGFNIRLRAVNPNDYVDYDYTASSGFWDATIQINDEVNNVYSIDEAASKTYKEGHDWVIKDDGFLFDELEEINNFVIRTRPDSDFIVAIDSIVLTHKQSELNYQFDNDITNREDAKRPAQYAHSELYGEPQFVEFRPEKADNNIDSATTTVTFNDTGAGLGTWGVQQSVSLVPGLGFTQEPDNTNSVSETIPYPGASHSVRVALSSRNQTGITPEEGYNKQTVDSISVDASFNSASIVSDDSLTDNRLAVINSLCKNSAALTRFNSEVIKIFPLESKKTNVDLYKEKVTSSVDITETYKSCLVKGKDGVTGKRIQVTNPPAFVKKDKLIISREIKSEEGANSKARAFLEKNGDIEYTGNITTLPTLAPVGAMIDGSNFNHGQDMTIENVRYNKRRTKLSLGFTVDVASQLIESSREIHQTHKEGVSKGQTLPTGKNNYGTIGGQN